MNEHIPNTETALAFAVATLKVIAHGGSYSSGDYFDRILKLERHVTDANLQEMIRERVRFELDSGKTRTGKK